ncbi:MAG: acyltransferase, partial [Burkholderiales bacterium]
MGVLAPSPGGRHAQSRLFASGHGGDMGADMSMAGQPAPQRQVFLDRLRALLTVLVVVHHAAITYGAAGDWFYRERAVDGSPASLLLTFVCAVNQAFFMGMFFLLAGYFTPGALQRKGPGRFLRERLVRLGVPVLVFGCLLGPLTVQLARGVDVAQLQWHFFPAQGWNFVMGPLWFCWALLLFSVAFVGLELARVRVWLDAVPGTATWIGSAVGVGLAAFVVRLVFPVGDNVVGLQLGYFVSYVFLFAMGCMAARHRLLERV